MNLQISFRRQAALATILLVLSASTVLGQVNAPVNIVRFKGAFDGRASGVVQAGNLVGTQNVAGSASFFGRFTLTKKDTTDLATGLSTNGVVQLVVGSGDVINGASVGRSGEATDTPNIGHAVFLVTITSGTGRFEGAKGVLTMDFLVDNTTIPAYISTTGTLTGTISFPGSTN